MNRHKNGTSSSWKKALEKLGVDIDFNKTSSKLSHLTNGRSVTISGRQSMIFRQIEPIPVLEWRLPVNIEPLSVNIWPLPVRMWPFPV